MCSSSKSMYMYMYAHGRTYRVASAAYMYVTVVNLHNSWLYIVCISSLPAHLQCPGGGCDQWVGLPLRAAQGWEGESCVIDLTLFYPSLPVSLSPSLSSSSSSLLPLVDSSWWEWHKNKAGDIVQEEPLPDSH